MHVAIDIFCILPSPPMGLFKHPHILHLRVARTKARKRITDTQDYGTDTGTRGLQTCNKKQNGELM